MHLKIEREPLKNSIILAPSTLSDKIKKIYGTSIELCSESIFTIQKKSISIFYIFEKISINYIPKQFSNDNCHRQHICQIGGKNY